MATAGGSSNVTSVSPISYTELDAWARLTGRTPQPWEVEWLCELDAIWLGPARRPGDDA